MTTLKSVEDLIQALNQRQANESYLDIMKRMDIGLREWERFYTWTEDHYTRNCLAKTEDYELLLICYEAGQQTPIHDFNVQDGWIHTLQGELREQRFRFIPNTQKLEQVSSIKLGPNDYSYLSGKSGIHRYINTADCRAVSLNLYAKPIEKWTEYDASNSQASNQEVGYHALFN